MEVFRICTLLSLVGVVFHGGAPSYGGGMGDVDGGFPTVVIRCERGGGLTDVSVNFATPKKFPPMRDLPGRLRDEP